MGWLSSGTEEVVEDTVGYQAMAREWGNIWKMRTRTRTVEIRGLTRSAALSAGSDVAYFTVTTGTAYFAHFQRTVRRRKANAADGWTVTITKTWQALYQNSTHNAGAAAHYFTDTNPSDMTQ